MRGANIAFGVSEYCRSISRVSLPCWWQHAPPARTIIQYPTSFKGVHYLALQDERPRDHTPQLFLLYMATILLLAKFYGILNHSPIFSQMVTASPFHSSLLSRTHSSQSPNSVQSISQIFCNASIGALTPPVGSDNAGPMTEDIQCSASASVHAM